jgi:hypothetical protein
LAQFLRNPESEREHAMRAAQYAIPPHLQTPEPRDLTLLALVQAVCNESDDDREVVATVCHLLRTGRVRLCGNFRGSDAEIYFGTGPTSPAKNDRSNRQVR